DRQHVDIDASFVHDGEPFVVHIEQAAQHSRITGRQEPAPHDEVRVAAGMLRKFADRRDLLGERDGFLGGDQPPRRTHCSPAGTLMRPCTLGRARTIPFLTSSSMALSTARSALRMYFTAPLPS